MFIGKLRLWVGLVALVPLALGCSSDDGPTGTGGGGGGGDKDVAPGIYSVSFDVQDCSPVSGREAVGGGPLFFDLVVCDWMSWEDVLDIGCTGVDVSGDNLTIDCQYTDEENGGTCMVTYDFQGTGSKSGDTWTITGQATIVSQTPANCSSNAPCEDATITVTLATTGAPTACQYGPAMTIENTVGGGPNPGKFLMDAGGSVFPGAASGWVWNIGGSYGEFVQNASSSSTVSNISFGIPEVATASLPASFPLAAGGGQRSASSGAGDPVYFNYYEQQPNGSYFFPSNVTAGTFTVNEVSAEHIAGRYTLSVSGTQFTPPSTTTASTRTMSGQYHVRDFGNFSSVSIDNMGDVQPWGGFRHAMKMR